MNSTNFETTNKDKKNKYKEFYKKDYYIKISLVDNEIIIILYNIQLFDCINII